MEITIDEELFERLRELRRTLAAEQEVPAYVVFGDRSLIDMAARRPGDAARSSSRATAWARPSSSATARRSSPAIAQGVDGRRERPRIGNNL